MAKTSPIPIGPRNDEWTIGDFLDRRTLVQTVAQAAPT